MYKVLIVEDDPMVAMINQHYVENNKDFSVVATARNGEEALAFLDSNSVDLIVLDVFMPSMDGVETLKQIRNRQIPSEVIMVTAANDSATLEETMHLGVLDYLIKPFTLERFSVSLEKFVVKVTTLKQNSILDQKSIDSIFTNSTGPKIEYPKGIQKKTLDTILTYFTHNCGWQSADMVAEKLGFSVVTVRHYLTYLVQSNQILEQVNYETGGRPSILYKTK